MEPTKNNNQSSEPVFHGMPKPGQPLATTPRVNATGPSPITTPPSNLPTSNSFSSQAPSASSPFSVHTPSALDRLMNPNIAKETPPTSMPQSGATQNGTMQGSTMQSGASRLDASQSSASQIRPVTPVAPVTLAAFKPYTPPVVPVATSVSSNPTGTSIPSSSGYKVGAPIQYPPASAPSLSSEVSSILNNQQKDPKSHKGTLALIVSMVVVLLLLAGGGYYWYTYMYLPSKENISETTKNSPGNFYNQNNTTNTNSVFPSVVTKSAAVTQPAPVKAAPPKTSPKITRTTTPFNQSQRDMVSSYIFSNINKLETPKSKTPYEVTDITFDGPDRAVVQYTNGKSSYTAVAVASIDTSNEIRIVSFFLLEK